MHFSLFMHVHEWVCIFRLKYLIDFITDLFSTIKLVLWDLNAKSLQLCPTLCDPLDGSPPGSPSLGFSRQEHWSGLPFPSPMHKSEKWKWKWSRVRPSATPWTQPTRLLHPWGFPGNSTGVGCHFLLQCMKVKSGSEVAQSCPTFSDPMDCSLPGSSVHGIFQARVLVWGAIAFSDENLITVT